MIFTDLILDNYETEIRVKRSTYDIKYVKEKNIIIKLDTPYNCATIHFNQKQAEELLKKLEDILKGS